MYSQYIQIRRQFGSANKAADRQKFIIDALALYNVVLMAQDFVIPYPQTKKTDNAQCQNDE